MLNLLSERLIRVATSTGSAGMTLPEIYAAAADDKILGFPALRPHQAPAFHAFLVQVAALGCMALDLDAAPGADPEEWGRVLTALTPDYPEDEPWSLVVSPDRPGLLQAPVPGGDLKEFKDEIEAPDAIDILVTAKNHDLKAGRMVAAEPEDWFFALLSLQTQEGFLGAGNYGIARMNGGFASRPYLRLAPAEAGLGGQVLRDIRALLEDRQAIEEEAERRGLMRREAIALLWLKPWDGVASLHLDQLHPLFVEICRRVRLFYRDGRVFARKAGSKAARIEAKAVNGVLGDPWAPFEGGDQPKLFTVTNEGFSYKKMTELLFGSAKRSYERPRLGKVRRTERGRALILHVAALARGQGKTEGFHARAIPISDTASEYFGSDDREKSKQLADRATEQVGRAGDAWGKALRPALITLVQKGPEEPSWSKPSNGSLVEPTQKEFDRAVDAIFFEHLWRNLEKTADEAAAAWARALADLARRLLEAAAAAAPRGEVRRIIAVARARNLLEAQLHKLFPDLRAKREAEDDAA